MFSVNIWGDCKTFMAMIAKIPSLFTWNFQKFVFNLFSGYKMKNTTYLRTVSLLTIIFKVCIPKINSNHSM